MDGGRGAGSDIAGRVLAAVPGVRQAAMARHPSGLRPEPASAPPELVPEIQVDVERQIIDLSTWEDGCGNGKWCLRCRQEIRDEALRWIRELNAPETADRSARSVPSRPWHPELLLGGA